MSELHQPELAPMPAAPLTPPEPLEPAIEFEVMVSSNTLNLCKVQPQHPLLRGLVLSETGQLLPPELTNFADIKAWLEKIGPAKGFECSGLKIHLKAFENEQYIGSGHIYITRKSIRELGHVSDTTNGFQRRLISSIRTHWRADIRWTIGECNPESNIHFYDSHAALSGALAFLKTASPMEWSRLARTPF